MYLKEKKRKEKKRKEKKRKEKKRKEKKRKEKKKKPYGNIEASTTQVNNSTLWRFITYGIKLIKYSAF